jgi:queuine/archaeosine tRNA-ribosyltransferase
LKNTRPYPSSVAKIAEFFGVPVDALTDASRELPPDPTEERFTAAKAAAAKMPVDQPLAGQAVFEKTVERSLHSAQMCRFASRLRAQAKAWMAWADEIDPPVEQPLSELHAEVERSVRAMMRNKEREEKQRSRRAQSSIPIAQGGAGR